MSRSRTKGSVSGDPVWSGWPDNSTQTGVDGFIPVLNDIDLRLFRVFLAVVEAGSFAAAETVLDYAQSTISNQMKELETRLGYRLCRRGRAGFSLTEEGKNAFRIIKRLMIQTSDSASELAAQRGDLSGTLNIGFLDTMLSSRWEPVEQAIKALSQQHPNARFALYVEGPKHLEAMLLEGQLHIVIGSFISKRSLLEYEFLFAERHYLYCGRGHPLFHVDNPRELRDGIRNSPLVTRTLWEKHDQKLAFGAPVRATIHSIDAKFLMVSSDTCIGFLPVHLAERAYGPQQLKPLLPTELAWDAKYYIVTRRGGNSPIAEAFLQDFRTALEKYKGKRKF